MSRIRADKYTNRAADGAPTFSDGVNVVGITSVNPGAGTTSMLVTGDLSVISGTIKGASELSISGITSSISDTAVDIFVYDTSKDSDGGEWRKRTTNTSWYNETLNTATRGSRKEFPSVAVIVAETTKLTIYDGDDPDLPMWMVFNQGGSYVASNNLIGQTSGTNSAISSLNGILSLTTENEALYLIKFISDTSQRITNSANREYRGGIGERNSGKGLTPSNSTNYIVNANCNDVAMTVLPNAPIDPSTGLPVPTIAVGTDGGVSVVKDDGDVFDLNVANRPYSSVDFTSDNLIFAVENPGGVDYDLLRYFAVPSADITTSPSYGPNSTPPLFPSNTKGNFFNNHAYGSPVGLSIIDHADGTSTSTSGMVAYATTSYNTGWMHGDIKGAFLSDTTDESFNTTNLVTEDFSANWTEASGGTHTVSSGQLTITNAGTNGRAQSNTFATTVGKKYAFIVKTVSASGATYRLEVRGPEIVTEGTTDGQTLVAYFDGTGNSSTFVELYAIGTSGSSATYENAYVVEVEEDRSENDKGLQVFGTITKSAVATGAELVAYSGFSVSNYLKQPYNSDLDFGTGDFYVGIWAYGGSDAKSLIIREEPNTDQNGSFLIFQNSGAYHFYAKGDGNSAWTNFAGSKTYGNYWSCVYLVRSGGTIYGYVNGEQVGSTTFASSVTNNDAELVIGTRNTSANATQSFDGSLALARVGAGAPSPEQIKKIYEDEKVLFLENAKATLYGSSDAVTALAFDEITDQLHVGTSSGRSDFQGLRRINNTTTAVTTAISASNELVAEQ